MKKLTALLLALCLLICLAACTEPNSTQSSTTESTTSTSESTTTTQSSLMETTTTTTTTITTTTTTTATIVPTTTTTAKKTTKKETTATAKKPTAPSLSIPTIVMNPTRGTTSVVTFPFIDTTTEPVSTTSWTGEPVWTYDDLDPTDSYVTTATTVTTASPVSNSVLGDIVDQTYQNKFFGIGCTLNEGWSFLPDSKVCEMNNLPADLSREEMVEALKDAPSAVDMLAENETGDAELSFSVEFIGSEIPLKTMNDWDALTERHAIDLQNMLETLGCEDVHYYLVERKMGSKRFYGSTASGTLEGKPLSVYVLFFAKEGYLASATFVAAKERQETYAFYDMFFLI